jgi:hypothetical protein
LDEKLKGQIKDQIKKAILQKTLEERIDAYKLEISSLAKTVFSGLCPICRKPDSPEFCLCTSLVKVESLEKVAPPGREKQVRKLKEEYGENSPIPFKIAWAQHNKEKTEKAENGVAGGSPPGIDAQTNMQMAEKPKAKLPMRKAGNVHGSLMAAEGPTAVSRPKPVSGKNLSPVKEPDVSEKFPHYSEGDLKDPIGDTVASHPVARDLASLGNKDFSIDLTGKKGGFDEQVKALASKKDAFKGALPKSKAYGTDKSEMSISNKEGSASVSVSESSGGDKEVRVRADVKKDEDFDTFDGNMKQGKPTGKLPDGKGEAKERNPKLPPSGTVKPKADPRKEGEVKVEKNPAGPTTHANGEPIEKADPMQNVNQTAKKGAYKAMKGVNTFKHKASVAKLESAALAPKDLNSKFTQRPGNIGTAKSDMLNVDSMDKGAVTPAPAAPSAPPVPKAPSMAKGDVEKCHNVPAMLNKRKLNKGAVPGTPKADALSDAARAAKPAAVPEPKVKMPSPKEHEDRAANFAMFQPPSTKFNG